uniref:Solute carrier family 12 member 8 n=1 Tax=Phallusia mammillata TaxID=59560 RepID=A0A6F9DRN2_9ASCI|nr:solute carrier family 12 member 8-like [Phallusia mammillata]
MTDTNSETVHFAANEHDSTQNKDLFFEETSHQVHRKPWWKSQFFVVEPVLFGTWDGVFTSCLINIFGVVLFLRTGWMVGNVGIGLSMLIVVITVSVASFAALSAIGLCERLPDMTNGGVYFLVSKVLGGKVGGTVGIMYAFGLCVVSALYCMGFAESVTKALQWNNEWAVRGVAIGTLLLLSAINLAGVKWVIRLQLLLLLILVISTSDFIVGTFVHTNPDAGFIGYSSALMYNNSYPMLQEGETFFTVFGVFFPTATGVMAGVNMSGDLKSPSKSIPVGTLSAIFISFMLYVVFVLLLGSTCLRSAMQLDFMIAEKVSAVGVLWLLGVYMSSTSSCSTGLYGAPRILQSIANENVIPAIKFLGMGFGANKTPVLAICVIGFISLLFILIGNLNVISPVITCNFMLVYAAIDYSYFALAMSYDQNIKNFNRYKPEQDTPKVKQSGPDYIENHKHLPGTMDEFTKDLDTLINQNSNGKIDVENTPIAPKSGKEYLEQSYMLNGEKTESIPNKEDIDDDKKLQTEDGVEQDARQEKATSETHSSSSDSDDEVDTKSVDSKCMKENEPEEADDGTYKEIDILPLPKSWYSNLCNRWSSLFGVFMSLTVMFLIHWVYALANILAFLLIYLYTSLFNPGLNPGAAAQFKFIDWVKSLARDVCRKDEPVQEEVVINSFPVAPYTLVSTQLTQDNEDFANRVRFHQSAVGDYDYASLVADNRLLLTENK